MVPTRGGDRHSPSERIGRLGAASIAAFTVRRLTPGSRFSASRMLRASWISLRVRPTSAAAGFACERSRPERSPPPFAGAISPRSWAASYSSARRRLASASISNASACARNAAATRSSWAFLALAKARCQLLQSRKDYVRKRSNIGCRAGRLGLTQSFPCR